MKRPYRSPIEIPSLVAHYLYGKSFCEIGCGEGDLLFEFSKYADNVIGIEIDPVFAESAKAKGLNVIEGNVLSMTIPKCDVYYFWVTDTIDEELVKILPKDSVLITHRSRHSNIHGWNSEQWIKDNFKEASNIEFTASEGCEWQRSATIDYGFQNCVIGIRDGNKTIAF